MNKRHARAFAANRLLTGAICILLSTGAAACDDFLSVNHPTVIDAGSVDPVRDGETFSRSAFQNFVVAYGALSLWSGIFVGELWVDDSGPAPGEFGRREIGPFTGIGQWTDLSRAIATSENAITLLRQTGGVNLARVLVSSGFAIQMMAEVYCVGVVLDGEILSTEKMLDLATQRFEEAITVASGLTGTNRDRFLGAAQVGLARAHLQAGRRTQAAAAAAAVAPGFEFRMLTVNDPANRARLGNAVYNQMIERGSQTVSPAYRAMADAGDTRIRYRDAGRRAQGGQLHLYEQTKFTNWNSPYLLASKLEARYLEEEAKQDPVSLLAFISERRAAANQGPFQGSGLQDLLRELMDQRSREFWLDGAKRHGDWRRHPTLVPNILPPGSPNYEPTEPPIGSQVCFPLPAVETDN